MVCVLRRLVPIPHKLRNAFATKERSPLFVIHNGFQNREIWRLQLWDSFTGFAIRAIMFVFHLSTCPCKYRNGPNKVLLQLESQLLHYNHLFQQSQCPSFLRGLLKIKATEAFHCEYIINGHSEVG